MDEHKIVCPNCSQPYFMKTLSPKNANLPLFLPCGHSMCEKCVITTIKCEEPLECCVCQTPVDTSIKITEGAEQICKHFPVNCALLGEIVLGAMQKPVNKQNEEDHYINLKEIISQLDCPQDTCIECHSLSSKICQQCVKVLCENCFKKTHSGCVVFADHILQDMEMKIKPENCKTHPDNVLRYYCFTCSKSICMDCMICGDCKNHDNAPFQKVQEQFMEKLSGIIPQVDEMYRRLTKSAVDIGNLLYKNSCEDISSEYSKIIEEVDQSYSKITASLQKQRMEAINVIYNIKNTKKESLMVAKNQIQEYILKAKKYLNKISSVTTSNSKEICLPALCIEGKEIIDGPWYLQTKESSDKDLKANIKTELYTLTNDFVQIEGKADCSFQLVTTGELPPDAIPQPPSAPVYPPELPKDVRQNNKPAVKSAPKPFTFYKDVPNYRSKHGSQSSLSSGRTETSMASKGERKRNKKAQQQVFPMPDNESFVLNEDTQELVYISHIVNPHNFFVQKSSHQGLVKMLLCEFGKSKDNDGARPSISHIGPGKSYLMFQKADSVWQRCRVLSVEGNNYKVFCYDFGSIETISIKELRLIPPKFAHSPPPLAFNCRLANCEPISGAWTDGDAKFMQTIINNKQAVMNIRRILPSKELGTTTLECDLTAYEDGTSLAHAFQFHERSRMPHSLKYPNFVTRREKCKIFINNNDYKLKIKENVVITHVINPDKFFVRRNCLQNVYEKMCDDLEKEYGKNDSKVYLPEIGMSCVAQLGGESARWERCVVRGLPGNQRVTLFLPDCGEEHVLHYSRLRYISDSFTRFSALANECHLHGITPLKKKWHPGSVTLLQQFEDRALELVVEEEGRRGSIGVVLTTLDDPTPVCLNNLMVEHKFAVTYGMFNFKRDFENQVKIKRSPLDTPKPPPKNPNQKKNLQRPATAVQQSSKAEDDKLDAKDKGPYRLEANLLNYQSPSLMYVSMVCQQKAFNELFENMQKYYSKQKSVAKSDWKVGDRCSALCAESGTWRRAVILEMDGDKAKLFFTDFACTELVQTSSLQVLAEPFAALGDAAIKCHISGVVPAGADDWPSITKEYLKDMLDAYPQLFIMKVGEFKDDKSMPVQLWVYHTTEGGALEPNISEWRCLNWRIVEQGLGMPDKSLEMGAALKNEVTDDISLSFLNMQGSVSDWLQLDPVAELVSTQHKSVDGTSSSSMIFVTGWLPPEPISSTEVEVEVMPTYIDNEGIIYFHQISQQAILELIRNTLNKHFGKPDPKAKFQKWTVGEPCIAMFYLDSRFYRGTVTAVDYEASSCTIYYIDYGNEEVCRFENMRKSIALHELPCQAHKCMLDRVRPPSGMWETSTLDYVHKIIVEKRCLLKVTGEKNEIMMVDLKFDKLCINDHLVQFDLAVYTDGSQPMKRTFVKSSDAEPPASTADSDPDYYIEDENAIGPGDDWVKCMDEEDEEEEFISFFIYADNKDDEFVCNVTSIHGVDWIELAVVDADEDPAYQLLFEEIKAEAAGRPPLDGVYQNKGCVALLQDDGKWYRASILQYSEEKRKAKVRFVDYGDVRVLPESDLREARLEWAEMEGAARRVTLHGVRIQCPKSDRDGRTAVLNNLYDILVEKAPLRATVVDSTKEGVPRVRLTDAAGELAYQSLIDDGSYVTCDADEPTEPTEPK